MRSWWLRVVGEVFNVLVSIIILGGIARLEGGQHLIEILVLLLLDARGLLRSGLALHCRDTARGKRALTFVLFENAMRGGIPAMDGSTPEKYEF